MVYKTRVIVASNAGRWVESAQVRQTQFVFTGNQIDGLPALFVAAPAVDTAIHAGMRNAAINAIPAQIGGGQAFYNRGADLARLPPPEVFATPDDFPATKWRELALWTGAQTRLDRGFGQRIGDKAYALEERVAELASVILGFELAVRPT